MCDCSGHLSICSGHLSICSGHLSIAAVIYTIRHPIVSPITERRGEGHGQMVVPLPLRGHAPTAFRQRSGSIINGLVIARPFLPDNLGARNITNIYNVRDRSQDVYQWGQSMVKWTVRETKKNSLPKSAKYKIFIYSFLLYCVNLCIVINK